MPIYIKERHNIGILRSDGTTKVGLMLVEQNGRPLYRTSTERYLKNQYYSGAPDYGALDPQSELPIIQDDWRSGFGLEVADSADPKRYYSSIGMDMRFRGMAIAGPTPTTLTKPSAGALTILQLDFEAGVDEWTADAGTWSQSNDENNTTSGTYSYKNTSPSTGEFAYQNLSGYSPGVEYTFTCYYYINSGVTTVKIGIDDGVGATYSSVGSTAGSWTQLSHAKTLSVAATRCRLVLYIENGSANNCYFDDAAIATTAVTVGAVPPRGHATFNDKEYVAFGTLIAKLNSTSPYSSFDLVADMGQTITCLQPFSDSKLYVCLGTGQTYYEMTTGDLFTINDLTVKTFQYFSFVHTTADTMYGNDSTNTIRSTTDPANGGTQWSTPATTVGDAANVITDLVSWKGQLRIPKEDMPYYLDTSGNVQSDLAPECVPITASTSGKNSILWQNSWYYPCGAQGLLETDGVINTWLNPASYCTNLSDFVGRVQAVAADEEWLYTVIDNGTKVEIVAGRRETVDGIIRWVWHPIAEIPTTFTNCNTAWVTSIYQKRLYVTSTSASETETLRPSAAGDECNINSETGDACPNHYLNVDEVTADGDTTTNHTNNPITYLRDFYNITDSTGSGVINHITVYAVCKAEETANQASLKVVIKSGTGSGAPDTADEGSAETIATSYTSYSKQWTTNPATSSAWTWDEIDKLQIGISLRCSVSTVPTKMSYCTQVYVVVDYYNLYYIPLPTGYGDITADANRKFKTGTYFYTPYYHGNFKGEDKAWIKITLTMGHTYNAGRYFTVDYQTLEGSVTNVGNFTGSATSMVQSRYIDVTNKPVSSMMRFKITAVTDDTDYTPVLLSYDIRSILRPTHRKFIECAVRCEDGIKDKKGLPLEGTSAAYIRTVLDEARDASWPFTFYDLWGNTKYGVILPSAPESEITAMLKNENPESYYYIRIQEVALT